jgi:protein-S-isoprenylcysteine O-methyltransferase Ste14
MQELFDDIQSPQSWCSNKRTADFILSVLGHEWERRFKAIAKYWFPKRRRIVRNAIKKDMLYFALPGITLWFIEVLFCASGLSGFWGTVWSLVKQPQTLSMFPVHSIIGLALLIIGFIIMLVGQITLWRSYSGTVVIREDHQLITRGIYRFTRNPMYLGGIMVITGLPVYVASLYGFLTSLVLIPIILNRIRLEEKLLTEEYQDVYHKYKETTKKLIPFIY